MKNGEEESVIFKFRTMNNKYKQSSINFLFTLLMVLLSILSFSATYYISNTGNDSNSGLTTTAAWQSLAKVNASSFNPGDQILFKKGDSWYGTLTIKQSGTAGNPITFGAYGTGANPIITGFTTVTGWTNLGNNIWESTNAVSTLSTCNMVVINGESTPMGRWPNLGSIPLNGDYLRIESLTGTSITNSLLSGDWTGADCVIRKHNTRIERRPIISQSGTTLNFASSTTFLLNFGFFIQNSPLTLDQQNEWYFNPTTKKIQVYSTSEPTNVKVSTIDKIITIDTESYLSFSNLSITGANTTGIYKSNGGDSQRTGYTISECSFNYFGISAIYLNSTIDNVIISGNTISYCNGTAIATASVSHLAIRDNVISHNGIIKGADTDGGAYSAISFSGGVSTIVENNTIVDTGNNGITFSGDSVMIKNNFIDTFNQIMDDGAGITGGDRSTNETIDTGNSIMGNIVINGIGANAGTSVADGIIGGKSEGIYTADNITYLTISNNSVANCANNGIYSTYCDHVYVTGNTVYNCTAQQLLFKVQSILTGDRIVTGNKFISKESTQLTAQYTYKTDVISSFMTIDNNIYARPIDDNFIIREYNGIGSATNKTLVQWQTYSGFDVNSKKSSQITSNINDLHFEYNETLFSKIVVLSQPMIDLKGIKYATKVTLQPFTSIVLMKDNNPSITTTEYKSICEGTSYNGWTTTGKYERTLSSKSGSDSLVTTFLTVNPKYVIAENVTIADGDSYLEWFAAGQYSRTLASVSGCDSTIVTNLTVEKNVTKQAEILPTHFIPVWQGENGLNHMNIMVVSAVLEDLPLNANDEIAVFDGAICVGSMKLSVPINSADNTTFLTIPASQNDGTNNGFNEQDSILFKIWDDLNQTEMLVKTIQYRNDLSSWITTGKFAAGSTSVVELVSFVESFQSIELVKGYNLISTYVAPLNSDASVVTQELSETGSLIKIQDEAGKSLEDWGSYGGWINQLGTIQNTEGYKIKVANNCILQVSGRPIALPLDIPLKTGWNIISFPRTDMVDALSVVQSLIDRNVLVKVQDELGNSVENWGIFGGWKNSIGFFMPGKAYKVKLSADAILTIQENYIKSALILSKTEKTEYFSSGVVGNGTDHMNINVIGLNESGISAGDELAAFDGNNCVGTLKITENNLIDGSAALVTSFSSDEQNPDGFFEGHPIQLVHWNKQAGIETQVDLDVLNGQALYAKNSSVLIRLKSMTTEVSIFDDRMKIDVFPNPCSGRFTVRFSNLPDAGSKLDILDVSGRKILSRMITDINEEFNLNNYSSGIYLVKSVINSKETIQKLIVN